MVGAFKLFDLIFRVVVDDHPEGPQDGHRPGRPLVQVFADTVLKEGNVHEVVVLGHPDGDGIGDPLQGVG